MPEPNLTPEEKLLKIIESPPGAVRGMRPQRRVQDVKFFFKAFKTKYAEKLKEGLNLKNVKTVLVFLSLVMTVFLALDFWMGRPRAYALARLEQAVKLFDVEGIKIERSEPLSIYLQEITERNIFALPLETSKEAPVPKAELTAEAKDFLGTLKLVGIIWSDAPQAIIEDTKEGRTSLLNRGGEMNGARVKEILKDRVILSYDNQELELR